MKTQNHNYSTIILAGGNAARMNYPKPWLRLDNDITFLAEIVTAFKSFGITDIVVVLNTKFTTKEWSKEFLMIEQNTTIIKNPYPEKGRLFSLQLGLKAIKNNTVFIHNVDNPFIENDVLAQLSNNIENNGITIPSFNNKGGHPVIINESVKNEIINNYKNYKTLKEVFKHFPKKYVEVKNSSILRNINTPEELKKAKNELA